MKQCEKYTRKDKEKAVFFTPIATCIIDALLWGETILNDGLTGDRIEELLLQLAQTYIKEVYVAYFGADYYKYKDLTTKTDIVQDLVSTE